jgi:hypothetical protein
MPCVTPDPERAAEHLRQLAAELQRRRFAARLRVVRGRPPNLIVINPAAPVLTESVLVGPDAEGRWGFYFPWPQHIAPAADIAGAADRIEQVLAEVGRSAPA